MSKRKQRHKRDNKRGNPAKLSAAGPLAVAAATPAMPKGSRFLQRWAPRSRLIGVVVAVSAILVGIAYLAGWFPAEGPDRPRGVAKNASSEPRDNPTDTVRSSSIANDIGSARPRDNPTGKGASASPNGESFLDAFGGREGAEGDGQPAPANVELERKLTSLQDKRDRLQDLLAGVSAGGLEEKGLKEAIDKEAAAFEKAVGAARQTRPDDPVPQWLTGELLMFIGGEPAVIRPYLEGAVAKGLEKPRVFASLARTLIEANQFDRAYAMAGRALKLDAHDPYVWKAFARAAGNVEKFAEILEKLRLSYAEPMPAWAKKIGGLASESLERLAREQNIRRAEASADDLPRVRLLIEHRRFKREASGVFKGEIEVTGRGEAILELFENEAPLTVANFLSLVEQKQYDGTRFYLSQAGIMVAGGDVGSVAGDPKDDGLGHPGYHIPDEYRKAAARPHCRGSLSMVNDGGRPNTAGSQFFITLTPNHPMDGRFTVFGRVIKGQDVVDAMTPGRTNTHVGVFGAIVPGDLLVRAEVIRKRPHEYKVKKLPLD